MGDLFDWPDMQYLTIRWSGRWRNIDVRYSALNGYPSLEVLYGTHFAGFKPWYLQRRKAMDRTSSCGLTVMKNWWLRTLGYCGWVS